ncbi:hypothetical protein BDV59DRAFT_31481 [Aspergillus ambiguus]|uniref:uncharacterized protein n=1 Tax=Aspergillus ambiguus TaxID=176160 RepID=UPI003CCE07DC
MPTRDVSSRRDQQIAVEYFCRRLIWPFHLSFSSFFSRFCGHPTPSAPSLSYQDDRGVPKRPCPSRPGNGGGYQPLQARQPWLGSTTNRTAETAPCRLSAVLDPLGDGWTVHIIYLPGWSYRIRIFLYPGGAWLSPGSSAIYGGQDRGSPGRVYLGVSSR